MIILGGFLLVLGCIFAGCLLIQLLFYWLFFARFAFHKHKMQKKETIPAVSVVICTRNESGYIQQFLPCILTQDYPNYEVVLVNDNSTDDSENILREMQQYHQHLQIVTVSTQFRQENDRKLALAVGIKSAKNDLVLVTGADCLPRSSSWITEMVNCSSEKQPMVLGYCSNKEKKGFLNLLISFDTVYTAMCYFSFALVGRPYMGMGKNILLSKKLFLGDSNYLSSYKTSSVNNALPISNMAKQKNTSISYNYNSQTGSVFRYESFSHWRNEKRKNAQSYKYYKFINRFCLRLYGVTGFLFYVSFIACLLSTTDTFILGILAALFCLRMLSQWVIFAKSCNKLKEKKLLGYIPLFDVFFTFLMPLTRGISYFKKGTNGSRI